MNVTINGKQREITESTTLAVALEHFEAPTSGVAVAVNDAVVPRDDWPRTTLQPDSTVEVLTAVQGG